MRCRRRISENKAVQAAGNCRFHKFRTKSQMEIMGLAIIVILLSVAFLFVVKFVILKEPSEIGKDVRESQLAANFLNTLLETSAPDCSGIQLYTLFEDCAERPPDIMCGSRTSCEYIQDISYDILQDTLQEWKVEYYFVATTDPGNLLNNDAYVLQPISATGDECEERLQGTQPLPSNPPVTVILHICQ